MASMSTSAESVLASAIASSKAPLSPAVKSASRRLSNTESMSCSSGASTISNSPASSFATNRFNNSSSSLESGSTSRPSNSSASRSSSVLASTASETPKFVAVVRCDRLFSDSASKASSLYPSACCKDPSCSPGAVAARGSSADCKRACSRDPSRLAFRRASRKSSNAPAGDASASAAVTEAIASSKLPSAPALNNTSCTLLSQSSSALRS
mmetsp:Transcript_51097/g.119635  ORF Transcript_51097/g.119635 Transcript_51097/m.119635 type:complete len:211 (+) Transcript_51097:5524-6156(+)